MAQSSKNDQKWWKESVIYQVYPASFRDVSGDGAWSHTFLVFSPVD